MTKKLKINIARIGFIVLLLSIWQVIGYNSSSFFFIAGSPIQIGRELIDLVANGQLHIHFAITAAEALTGLLIGTAIGTLGGLFLWYSRTATEFVRPFIITLATLPVFALAPLFIFWVGIGFWMKVTVAIFSTVFVAFNQAQRGSNSVSSEFLETLKGMNATKTQIFRKVIVPASFNWVFSSMRLNVGFGLLGAFIGEFISSQQGLGYLILRSAALYNVSRTFAAAIGITILALLLDFVAQLIEKKNKKILQAISVPDILRKP